MVEKGIDRPGPVVVARSGLHVETAADGEHALRSQVRARVEDPRRLGLEEIDMKPPDAAQRIPRAGGAEALECADTVLDAVSVEIAFRLEADVATDARLRGRGGQERERAVIEAQQRRGALNAVPAEGNEH